MKVLRMSCQAKLPGLGNATFRGNRRMELCIAPSLLQPDDRPSVWTGSCPVNLSARRQAKEMGLLTSGTSGRHSFHLINQCRPCTIFGEQVASKRRRSWSGSTLYALTAWKERLTPAGA